jgi:mycothiol S-conjugate amidase
MDLGAGRTGRGGWTAVASWAVTEPRSLLTVHAHPDDEASKGAPTVARYAAEGVRTTLVCCTGGEAGDVLNPALDAEALRQDLPAVRRRELERSAAIIGYDEIVLMGYHDSGMPGTPVNERPDNFANARLDEAVGRLVAAIRAARPQVVVTYGDDQKGYPHPDHLRVHDISLVAWDRSGDPAWYPEAGEPWEPAKLYYTVWSRARMVATHERFEELGLTSPFTDEWFARPSQDHRITTQVDIGPWYDVRWDALLAHETQVDPSSPFWFGLPREVSRTIHPYDDYILARSRVRTDVPEDDLFAGID